MSDVTPTIAELVSTLDQEQAGLDALLVLFDQEREAIRTLSSDALTSVNRAQLKLLGEIRAVEETRRAIVHRLAEEWAVDAERLTLRAIADRIGAPEAGRLLRRQDRLNEAIRAARDGSAFLGTLIADSLSLFREVLSIWQRGSAPRPLYAQSGELQPVPAGGSFLARKG